MIEPGERAPDLALPDQDGQTVRLSDLRGRRVVLYLYPTAATLVSTGVDLRDREGAI